MQGIRKFLASFRAKLMLLVLLPAIPAFALALQRNLDQRKIEKESVLQEISVVSRLIAAHEMSFVRNTRQLLATLSGLDFLVNAEDARFCNVHFENLLKLSPDYLNFGLIESNGTVFASGVLPPGTPDTLADRSYFQRTLASRKFSIGTFQVGRLTQQPGLNFGFPITNGTGNLQRVLFASLKIEKLTDVARAIAIPEDAVVNILDAGGNILARVPEDGGRVGRAWPDTQLVQKVREKRDGVIESLGLDGVKRFYAITPISDDISEQIFVTVGVPSEVLFASANQALRRNLLVMLGTIVIALLIASLFAERALVRPIHGLSDAANQLAHGNLSARYHLPSSAIEIRRLSEAFNSMAGHLQEREAQLTKAHDDITRINADLEQRVLDRTAELSAVNQELEAFSYSVSHDLRAPLRHMDGFAELLKRDQSDRLDEKGRRHLNVISDAARKMGNLIDDLLVFSRMGRQEMRKSTVSMDALVRDAIQQQEHDLSNRRIEWEIAPLPAVHGDAALLIQVWLNLISNAVKYSRTRDVARIAIGCDESDSEYNFFVRDNGVGFDMKYADKLFGVFQRLHREDEFEGTGVGLANVRRIVVRHGGRTWADSVSGEGSVFYFSISKNA